MGGVVLRASDGGMDDEFLAFAKFIVEAKVVHAASVAEVPGENASEIGSRDDSHFDTTHTCLDLEEVQAGKYVGSTFAELFDEDQEYCSQLVEDMMKKGKRGSPLWPLSLHFVPPSGRHGTNALDVRRKRTGER